MDSVTRVVIDGQQAFAIIGTVLGFIGGVFLAELVRVKSVAQAWPTTVTAMKAAGLSMLIDLASVLIVTAAWIGAVIAV
mgnify:CR=1 FL=1